MEQEVLLELKNVSTHFKVKGGVLKAVDGVSLQIHKGETVGLVGESGCGKSSLGRTIMRLYKPQEGQILYKGKDVWTYNKKEAKQYCKNVQMIFQDPYASLDPLSVGIRYHCRRYGHPWHVQGSNQAGKSGGAVKNGRFKQ